MKNPGCSNNRGSPLYTSGNLSYQIPLLPNAPAAMRLKAKAACGDDDASPSNTGLCSDFYVFRWVLTLFPPRRRKAFHEALLQEILAERVVSSRGLRRPRGVRRQQSKFSVRRRQRLSQERIEIERCIRIIM